MRLYQADLTDENEIKIDSSLVLAKDLAEGATAETYLCVHDTSGRAFRVSPEDVERSYATSAEDALALLAEDLVESLAAANEEMAELQRDIRRYTEALQKIRRLI